MSPKQKRPTPAEVKHVVQEAVLRNYPNPERKGCPGTEVLREVAQQWLPPEDDHWDHISQCSPCYREFLDFRRPYLRERKRQRLVSRLVKVSAIALVLAVPTLYWITRKMPLTESRAIQQQGTPTQAAQSASTLTATLDFKNDSVTRGIQTATPSSATPQRLPRARLDHTVYLPIGSEPGLYDVHVLRGEPDSDPLARLSGSAQIETGLTTLHMNIDLSEFVPGTYTFATRHEKETWRYHAFTVF